MANLQTISSSYSDLAVVRVPTFDSIDSQVKPLTVSRRSVKGYRSFEGDSDGTKDTDEETQSVGNDSLLSLDDDILLTPTGHTSREEEATELEPPILQLLTIVEVDRRSRATAPTKSLPNEVVFPSDKDDEIPRNGTSYSELGVDGMSFVSAPKVRKAPSRFTFDMVPSESSAEDSDDDDDNLEEGDSSERILLDLKSLQEEMNSMSNHTSRPSLPSMPNDTLPSPAATYHEASVEFTRTRHLRAWCQKGDNTSSRPERKSLRRDANEASVEFTRTTHVRICQLDEEYKVFSPRPSWEREETNPKSPIDEVENDKSTTVPEDVESRGDEFNIFSPRSPCHEKTTREETDDHPTAYDDDASQHKNTEPEPTNEDLIGERFVDDTQQAVSLWLDMGWLAWW